MRVLVTGSREFTDQKIVQAALRDVTAGQRGPHTLVHGAARGADTLAAIASQRLHWDIEAHPADWGTHDADCPPSHRGFGVCRRAGHRRNTEMVRLGADICIAFYKLGAANKGAADCVQLAGQAGTPVRRWTG